MRGIRVFVFTVLICLFCSQAVALGVDPYGFEPPVAKDYEMPYTLTVYLGRQMVVAYDAVTGEPARYMICSSGLYNPTPKFDVLIPGTVIQPWAKWGSLYLRFPTRIKGSYYFHSIVYNSRNSVNSVAWKRLGYKASHGCVRLTPLDAQWIAYNCKKGTRVRVVDNDTTGLGLADKHNSIKAYLNKNGIAAVQPTLKPTPTPLPPDIDENSTQTVKIKSLQKELKGHGFYNGALTGVFTGDTVVAWNEYQVSQGWAADSLATTEEQVHIANDEETVAYKCDLKLGSIGLIVKRVEERLNALGYFNGQPNKGYDSVTVAAVKKYQKARGITPVNGKLSASQQPDFFSGAVPSPTPNAGLTIGSSGDKVKRLQNRLYTLGFFSGQINGKFTVVTQSAVMAYQKAAGLSQTGTVSDALYNEILATDKYVGTARTLSIGSKGLVVTAVEKKLALMGLFAGTPDNLYDSNTYAAMKNFQSQKGMNPTGKANTETLEILFAA